MGLRLVIGIDAQYLSGHVHANALEIIYRRYEYFACIQKTVTRKRNKEKVTTLIDVATPLGTVVSG